MDLEDRGGNIQHDNDKKGTRTVISDLQIHIVEESEFAGMRDEWNAFLASSESNNIFLTWEWLFTWWCHFKNPKRSLGIICVKNTLGEIKGLFPIFHEIDGYSRISLEFLGSGEVCSDQLDFILCKGEEESIIMFAFEYLIRHWKYHTMTFSNLPVSARNLVCIERVFQKLHVPWLNIGGEICPILLLPTNSEEFYRRLGSGLRSNMKRMTKKFREKYGTGPYKTSNFEELDSAFQALFSLHRARRSTKDGQSTFLTASMKSFHIDVGKKFLERGWLRLYSLDAGNKTIGSLYCFSYADRVVFYQAGFDPAFKEWSVGQILIGKAVEDAILQGAIIFDFLRGAEEYKWRWTNKYRLTTHLKAYAPNLFGKIRFRYDCLTLEANKRIKKNVRGDELTDKEYLNI